MIASTWTSATEPRPILEIAQILALCGILLIRESRAGLAKR